MYVTSTSVAYGTAVHYTRYHVYIYMLLLLLWCQTLSTNAHITRSLYEQVRTRYVRAKQPAPAAVRNDRFASKKPLNILTRPAGSTVRIHTWCIVCVPGTRSGTSYLVALLPWCIVIRTHNEPKNPYITLFLHTKLGPDY